MGSTSRKGQAQINPSAPEALGVCDRCGRLFNLRQLTYQYDWVGTHLQNLQLKVCSQCYDEPQEQLRTIILPPDPLPVYDPRLEPFAIDEASHYTILANFTATASMAAILTTAPQPLIADIRATAAMVAALTRQANLSASISATASMTVAFAGQQNITALIQTTAAVTATLFSGLLIQGADIQATATVAATLQRQANLQGATISATAAVTATMQQGMAISGATISATAAVTATLTQLVPAKGRYVNRYSYTWSGTSASFTIPSGDLTLAGSGKQLLVFFPTEVPVPTGCTIGGTNAYLLGTDASQFIFSWGATYAGAGNVNVTVTGSSSSEQGSADVYEFTDCDPLYGGYYMCADLLASANAVGPMLVYAPIGGVTAASAMEAADTTTFTWTGALAERTDADAGAMRLSSGDNLTGATSEVRSTATATASAGTIRPTGAVTAAPTGQTGVRGGIHIATSLSVTGATATVPASRPGTDHTNAGSFKLVFCFGCEVNTITPSSVTYNGSAMTFVGSVINTGASPDFKLYVYEIDVTQAAPNGALVVTWSATMGTGATFFYSIARLYGVGSIGTAGTDQNNNVTASTTVTVNTGGIILAWQMRGADAGDTNTWSGLDEVIDADVGSMGMTIACRYQCAAQTNRPISCTNTVSGAYAMIAVPFNP
jgi:hypothetical protein